MNLKSAKKNMDKIWIGKEDILEVLEAVEITIIMTKNTIERENVLISRRLN
jgi:hypothetical protein